MARDPVRANRALRRALALALGLVVALGSAELALRASGVHATYSERNFGTYIGVWGRTQPTWVHAWEPHNSFVIATPEFRYVCASNGDGLRDADHALERDPGRTRIVVLGDSFVEGAGVEPADAWPAVLARLLERDGIAVEVFNAGISGSDPFFEYQLLRQRLLRYGPDLVIVAVNRTDVSDTIWWGGLERFREDGSARGRPAPRGFGLYRHSHLARGILQAFFRFDRETQAFPPHAQRNWDAQHELLEAFAAIDALRAEHPFQLLVLVHPLPYLVAWKDSGYFREFYQGLAQRGIDAVDLAEGLHAELAGQPVEDFSWPGDGHFNARGYAAMARAVETLLLARLPRPAPAAAPR